MFRRIMLALTFIAALCTVGVGFTNTAEAWRSWSYGRPYGAYYYGPRAAYYGPRVVVPYRTYYAPRYYSSYYYGPDYADYYYPDYYYRPRSRVYVSFGF